MKIRNGFVSNSSSASFLVTNKTDHDLTFVQLIEELTDKLLDAANKIDSADKIIPARAGIEVTLSNEHSDDEYTLQSLMYMLDESCLLTDIIHVHQTEYNG